MQELRYKAMSKKEFANMVGISVRTLNRWLANCHPLGMINVAML